MRRYFVNRNAQDTGEHEVHHEHCSYLPDLANRKDLGKHSNCASAVREAKKSYDDVDGCAHCVPECHTR